MIQYPSIDAQIRSGHYYVFPKFDGSNCRAQWNRKRSFYKFGKRNGLLDDQTPYLSQAKDLILSLYGDQLDEIFRSKRVDEATAFFEFYGPTSAFGVHYDEPHTVTLIDIHVHKRGILLPNEFLDWCRYIDHAPCLYQGPINEDLIRQIKDGTLEGMAFEGVVCKGKGKHGPDMFKIKSNAWYQTLRDRCKTTSRNEQEAEAMFTRLS